ncbi:hypothetical protein IHC92_20670 [Photobacterium damselae subsp. damselae]|uniref:hypothetical protein n=1 Tax=Photobacterium damselae TaxID=38293 RepID=UPI001F3F6A1A|nr:hypothetical protein [Photobacterium damselae]UKA23368.1 hypothetical protein IHC92_20670 [Photobacterium damselae subsp. damselae]
MKKLVLGLIVACSFSVSAAKPLEVWDVNRNNVPIVMSQLPEYGAMYDRAKRSVVIIALRDCQDNGYSVMDVNGTPVKFELDCNQSNERFVPRSDKGKKYLLKQFKTKDKVIISGITFSAKGFAGSLRNAERKEKEAL